MKIKRILGFSNSEKGFTLIEIIAVLVILGILAAVAIPRYVSLQTSAREMAAQAAIAEMSARCNAAYAALVADYAVDPNKDISTISFALVNAEVDDLSGDFVATFKNSGEIEVTKVQGETVSVKKQWTLPIF